MFNIQQTWIGWANVAKWLVGLPNLAQRWVNITRGPGALKLVNSIAKYQLQVCQRMYIYALNRIIMKIKYVLAGSIYLYLIHHWNLLYVRFPSYILLILHTF